jgi:hypothetical protein
MARTTSHWNQKKGKGVLLRTKHQYSIEKPQEKYSTP